MYNRITLLTADTSTTLQTNYTPIRLIKHTHKSFTPVSFHKISFNTKEFLFQISSLLFLPIVQISLQTSHLIKRIILTITIKKSVFKFPYFLIRRYAAAAAKSLRSCLTLCDPTHGSHQAPLSLGSSRQEYWSGLPFPSPPYEV